MTDAAFFFDIFSCYYFTLSALMISALLTEKLASYGYLLLLLLSRLRSKFTAAVFAC